MTHSELTLRQARQDDLSELLPLVRAYHGFERVAISDRQRAGVLGPLLQPDSDAGRLWLIETGNRLAGYVAICFGYSIEFGGRDAFLDELYIAEAFRGQGLGGTVLECVKQEAWALGVRALHLEVARDNGCARRLYEQRGFQARERYHLMSCPLAAPPDA
jgi:GNAT superfamily N-acetyltransferase